MTAITRSRIANMVRAAAPLAVVAVLAAILLRFPPEQFAFYPQCPIYRYLHIQCPGCGTTRAFAALLHGHIREALRLNAFTTFLTLPAAIYAALCYRSFLLRKPFHLLQPPSAAIYATLAIAAIFSIVRNSGHI
ncbi:MAG: DUF2752 domain-containing protein [Edaphobacter sp.]